MFVWFAFVFIPDLKESNNNPYSFGKMTLWNGFVRLETMK
jgi:hypothetical protein